MGDIELGAGTLTDDFISDKALSNLIRNLAKKKHPIDLVLNGDTFDFLKCPHIVDGENTYPRHISSDISLQKIEGIYKAHTSVFTALAKFISSKKKKIYFIIGNHDHDLFHKEVQMKIKEYLDSEDNIYFSMYYNSNKVYAEHGQQYDFLNKFNVSQMFLTYHQKPILNFPWISFGLMSNMMFIKEKHPFMERIRPYPLLLNHHKMVLHKMLWDGLKYLFLSIFYYPFRYLLDPTYSMPRGLLGEFYSRVKNVHWDVDNIVEVFKRRSKKILRKNTIHVLGHVHEKYVEEKKGYVIIHPDTWRDEYTMDPNTKKLYPKTKMYVQVLVDKEDNLTWNLLECPIKRTVLDFEHVIKDEKKHLYLAAFEENYNLLIDKEN